MILTASKYGSVPSVAKAIEGRPRVQTHGRGMRNNTPRSGQIYIPRLDKNPQMLQDWYWKELRSGCLLNYLLRERAKSPQRIRAVARRNHGFRQNPKSDMQFRASIPAREFFRWKQQDPDFFSDDSNLRSLKRDNPELPINVPAMPMPRSRFKKVYPA
jgi:hypothetical protein